MTRVQDKLDKRDQLEKKYIKMLALLFLTSRWEIKKKKPQVPFQHQGQRAALRSRPGFEYVNFTPKQFACIIAYYHCEVRWVYLSRSPATSARHTRQLHFPGACKRHHAAARYRKMLAAMMTMI